MKRDQLLSRSQGPKHLPRNKWLDSPILSRHVSPREDGEPYTERYFDSEPRFPGFRTRISKRWCRDLPSSKEMMIPVPYIDKVGKFSIHRLGVWRTTPEQFYMSVASTISSRLWTILRKRSGDVKNGISDRNLITRISLFHAYHHNNYFIDRILPNLFPGRMKYAKSIFKSFKARAGETFRFVYSQTSLQVSWLNFRSKRIRDKPHDGGGDFQWSSILTRKKIRGRTHLSYLGVNPFVLTLDYSKVRGLEFTKKNLVSSHPFRG